MAWAKENILIAVAGGADGTSGVKDGADVTMRQEMEKAAHIIFAGSLKQRDFGSDAALAVSRSSRNATTVPSRAFGAAMHMS